MGLIYVDTSVLAKRYVRSGQSDAVDDLFAQSDDRFAVTELCLVEMESVLARRSREAGGNGLDLPGVHLRFDTDLRLGFFEMHTLSSALLVKARQLVASGAAPLATLDALHLSAAIGIGADTLTTDDRQLARAARAHGLGVITFI